MEAIVERIVKKCIQSELIEESQCDWMAYSLQRKFMNFGGFFILVCFGILVAPLPQVILLNFGLAFLREKTNGLHMPTVFSCFITSLFCEYACLYPVSYTHLMKAMREELKAVERLRKAADQLARQEQEKSRDRGPER